MMTATFTDFDWTFELDIRNIFFVLLWFSLSEFEIWRTTSLYLILQSIRTQLMYVEDVDVW